MRLLSKIIALPIFAFEKRFDFTFRMMLISIAIISIIGLGFLIGPNVLGGWSMMLTFAVVLCTFFALTESLLIWSDTDFHCYHRIPQVSRFLRDVMCNLFDIPSFPCMMIGFCVSCYELIGFHNERHPEINSLLKLLIGLGSAITVAVAVAITRTILQRAKKKKSAKSVAELVHTSRLLSAIAGIPKEKKGDGRTVVLKKVHDTSDKPAPPRPQEPKPVNTIWSDIIIEGHKYKASHTLYDMEDEGGGT